MLGTRIVTALVLATALLSALFMLPYQANVLIFSIVTAVAAWEWAVLMSASLRGQVLYPIGILAGCGVLHLINPLQPIFWLVAAIFWILPAPIWLVRGKSAPTGVTGYLMGAFLLLATWTAMGSLLKWGDERNMGPTLLLGCMALVWIADIAAYFFGRLFGKHKLAPAISPGKTWEGVAGALFGVTLAGVVAFQMPALPVQFSLPQFIGALVLLTAVSIVGDLFESLLKRRVGLKDSSKLLPGHGGVLDRIDSLISTLPVAALILSRSLT